MKNSDIIISGSGVYHPPESISNEELVSSYNKFANLFNRQNAEAIKDHHVRPVELSTAEYIEKVSGIKSRYVIEKAGILNPEVMHPIIEERDDERLSLQAEMGLNASIKALQVANKSANDIDAILLASSSLQRPFPATAIEIQQALGVTGFAYDLNVACASASFAIDAATNLLLADKARAVLVINPEICSAYLNFKARDSHFILGDAATALVLEKPKTFRGDRAYKIKSSKLWTSYSNNVRNNFGFLGRLNPQSLWQDDKLFYQNGKKVFKEVSLAVCEKLANHLQGDNLSVDELAMFWMHQANLNMNHFIIKKLAGNNALDRCPIILDEFANTASCGAIIAFNKTHHNLNLGDHGLLSSFGAGYSIGSILLQRTL